MTPMKTVIYCARTRQILDLRSLRCTSGKEFVISGVPSVEVVTVRFSVDPDMVTVKPDTKLPTGINDRAVPSRLRKMPCAIVVEQKGQKTKGKAELLSYNNSFSICVAQFLIDFQILLGLGHSTRFLDSEMISRDIVRRLRAIWYDQIAKPRNFLREIKLATEAVDEKFFAAP
jgi:hypothetical protein